MISRDLVRTTTIERLMTEERKLRGSGTGDESIDRGLPQRSVLISICLL